MIIWIAAVAVAGLLTAGLLILLDEVSDGAFVAFFGLLVLAAGLIIAGFVVFGKSHPVAEPASPDGNAQISDMVETRAPFAAQAIQHASSTTGTSYADLDVTTITVPAPFTRVSADTYAGITTFTLHTKEPVTCVVETLAVGVGTPPNTPTCFTSVNLDTSASD